MSFITNGLDTSKVYKRSQPPGEKCSDLFGNFEAKPEKSEPPKKKVVEPAPEKAPAPAVDKVTATAEKLADVKVTEAPQKVNPQRQKQQMLKKLLL